MVNLNHLKSLFIVEDSPEAEVNSPSPDQSKPVKSKGISSDSDASNSGDGPSDQRIMNTLLKALEDNNEDGFDFLEFKNSLKAMGKMSLDEATCFQSAFATASTMGVTVNKLLDSVDFYKKVLSAEKDKFNKTLQDQINDNVAAKEKQIDTLNANIKKKSDQIAALTQEISTNQSDLAKLRSTINDSKGKIEATKNNFLNTYNSMLQQINDDAGKIKKYLGGSN